MNFLTPYTPTSSDKKSGVYSAMLSGFIAFTGTGGFQTPDALINTWGYVQNIIEKNTIYQVDTRSTKEKINFIRDNFSLNMSELAKIIGVTRPTVYAWLQGQEPKLEALENIQYLAYIAEEINHLNIIRIDALIHRPLFNGQSFFDKLCNNQNIIDFLPILKEIADKEAQVRMQSKGAGKNLKALEDVINEYSRPFYPDRS